MARILVTGGAGQVGIELGRASWPEGTVLLRPTRDELDIGDEAAVNAFFAANTPDAVINTAAYTAVDKAEGDIAAAWAANAVAPALLAAATARAGIPIVHVSTDYVFDGQGQGAYRETDAVRPLGVYGASKLAGEIAVSSGNPRSVILRTAWVLSAHRGNFIKTMLRIGAANPRLRVVDDQRGCPTSAADIADTLAKIVQRMLGDPAAPTGVYHFVNAGEASWCELARTTFTLAAAHGGPCPEVEAITTAEYPTPARRPANSCLSTEKLGREYGIVPRPWQQAVDEIVGELMAHAPHGKAS